ncbi:YjfB family protein [Paenibacillus thermoaerophilus]|uniref:YjfB family protein n=1 Tax=Paenibacillus thermoaerophilus TaxID=1215385 RepID=A0ABW2V941_9BACL|nr:YjfB family protein [Paenibacillus thermoaerophilus]TMV12486.1 putative motility protein [Paenibacillus thermoaerophilus]
MEISLISAHSQFSRSDMSAAVGLRVLDMAQDHAAAQGASLVRMMEQSVLPHLGGTVDIKV